MRYFSTLLLVLLITATSFSQSFIWTQSIEGDFDNYGYCCAADEDGNYYFAGKFKGVTTFGDIEFTTSNGVRSLFFLKTNHAGEILWVKEASHVLSQKSITPYDMRVDADGNIYIVGAYYHQTRFSDEVVLDGNEDVKADCFVAKYSSAGEIVWIKSFSGPGNDHLEAIALEGARIYVGGRFSETLDIQGTEIESDNPEVGSSSNPFIMALSDDGTVDWIDVFHSASGICRELEVVNNQLYYTLESKENIWLQQFGSSDKHIMKKSTGLADVYLGRIDANTGVAVWDNLIGSTKTDMSYCLDVNNNKIIAGGSFSEVVTFESQDGNLLTQSSNGSSDTYFCQYTSDGNLDWIYTLGAEKADITNGDLVIDDEGNMFASGYFMSPSISIGPTTITSDATESYIIKLNSSGQLQAINQSQSFGKRTYLQSLALTPSGDIVFTATSTGGTEFLSTDFSVNEDKEQMIFGVISETETAVDDIKLADVQVYPNPTNSIVEVTAEFRIEQLQLFDQVGKLVLSSQTDKMDLTNLEKGIYLLKIEGDGGRLVRKVIKE